MDTEVKPIFKKLNSKKIKNGIKKLNSIKIKFDIIVAEEAN